MNELFNYSTLDIKLNKKFRSLTISFRENQNYISLESLFELESILAWASNRLEINAILLTSLDQYFNEGIDKERLAKYDSKKLVKITEKLQKIVHAMYHLPQTIIVDLKKGSFDLGSELALGADIRIADSEVLFAFNHNRVGLTPSSGGLGFLNSLVGQTFARNWLLLGKEIDKNQLMTSGFLSETYAEADRLDTIEDYLFNISQSAPVQRVQSKLGLLECVRESLDETIKFERSISKAAMISEDWRSGEFMKAKNMGCALKIAKDNSKENSRSENETTH